MVDQLDKNLHYLVEEVLRWRKLLVVKYQAYKFHN